MTLRFTLAACASSFIGVACDGPTDAGAADTLDTTDRAESDVDATPEVEVQAGADSDDAADIDPADVIDPTDVPISPGPCLVIHPDELAFGPQLVGQPAQLHVELASCGQRPLTITEIALAPGSGSQFTLSLYDVPGIEGAPTTLAATDAPVLLQPGQNAWLTITYLPDALASRDADGQPIRDRGTLAVRSDALPSPSLVPLSGFGAGRECPLAVIGASMTVGSGVVTLANGAEVIPQTRIHLDGSQSRASDGEIASFAWAVDQPLGSGSLFFPSASTASPTFELNVAGRYVFRLRVTDYTGEPSCVPAKLEVVVPPESVIHVELLWRTPNDPDETDEAVGADLDLHFAHPLAVGGVDRDGDGVDDGWFDPAFDCYWQNEQPNWGAIDASVADNPSLDRDDTDGLGPENLNLPLPENGTTYKVGVHYWNGHGFGTSYATVRVYIHSTLVFEASDMALSMGDMWHVTDIGWPAEAPPEPVAVCAGTASPCASDAECGGATCGPHVIPLYRPYAMVMPY